MDQIKKEGIEFYSFLDNLPLLRKNEKEFVQKTTKKFESLNMKYKNTEEFKEELIFSIFPEEGEDIDFSLRKDELNWLLNNQEDIKKIIKKFGGKKVKIFIFPTLDKFVVDNMGGVTGHCFVKDFIFVFLNSKGKNWKESFKETVIHEFAHSLSPYYLKEEVTLGQSMIFEGLAENFRESVFGGKSAPYSIALNENEIRKYLSLLKNKLDSKDEGLYEEVFFGSKNYPTWTGYSIGYYLVKNYLKNKKNINWKKILRSNPQEILEEALSKQNLKG